MSGASLARFKSEEELNKACKAYFEKCLKKKEIPSKAGLFVALDISRETYSQYKKKFPDAVKRSEAVIEAAWVKRLQESYPTGAIFYLKNAFKDDYRDRYETDLTSGGKPLIVKFDHALTRSTRKDR